MTTQTVLAIQIASHANALPSEQQLRDWANVVLSKASPPYALTLRIVDSEESTQLNETYRKKNGPTNVLSFPFVQDNDLPAEANVSEEAEEANMTADTRYLGDIVLCAPVIASEADAQHKPLLDHWAHMVIHGCLHLLGYDHQHDRDAAKMEALEKNYLASLGLPDPYEQHESIK